MNFIKKILCALIVCALTAPCSAFAADITEYETASTISLFNENVSGAQPTNDEAEFMEYLASELKQRHTEIKVPEKYNIDSSHFGEVYRDCMGTFLENEHPELFYVGEEIYYNLGTLKSVKMEFIMSDAEIDEAEAAISNELEKIKGLISDDMTDAEKVLLVHDYIAAGYEYDMRLYTNPGSESRRLDTMVMQKTGVCQGYANLFKYIMDNIDIECVNVPSNECYHVWNKVKINVNNDDSDAQWYNIDVTSDDPTMDMASNISHNYFLLNDDEIKQKDIDLNLADPLHSAWNEYKWDNKTPVEISNSEDFSQSVVHDIPGQMIYKDKTWYGFADLEESQNTLITIDVTQNTVTPVSGYTDSSNFIWFAYGSDRSYYPGMTSSIVLYDGDIYFNSPNKVYKYDTEKNSADVVYDFVKENNDKKDDSNTYLFGIRVRDNALYIEYTTQPYDMCNNQGELIVSAKMDGIIQIIPEPFICSSSPSFNDETGEVTVTLSIPEEIEEIAKVMIAEFDENGVFIGLAQREENQNTVTFTPDDECKSIKTFIWDICNTPLSEANPFTIPDSTDNSSTDENIQI
ncbi:MAG: transglutaminase domain-containing protein [Hominilimicola sp.]